MRLPRPARPPQRRPTLIAFMGPQEIPLPLWNDDAIIREYREVCILDAREAADWWKSERKPCRLDLWPK